MTTGFIAPNFGIGEKTSMSASLYHDGRWVFQNNTNLYVAMDIEGADGSQSGWGDGTTQNASLIVSGTNGKVHDIGFDYVNDILYAISFTVSGGGFRLHETPYNSTTKTYGATTTTRLDGAGMPWDNSGFDKGPTALIVDQQGHPLIFAIGAASDTGTLSPKKGVLVGYANHGTTQDHAQIDGSFDRAPGTTTCDPFLFNDGTDDYVAVFYCDGTNYRIAYHITEASPANYATGWVTESVGQPVSGTDDHICARAHNGELYAVVKGASAGSSGSIYVCHGAIDTATNNSTFTFTEVQTAATRPVIVIDTTGEQFYVFYAHESNNINYKAQPLDGYAFTPSDVGTSILEDASGIFRDPNPPAHTVSAEMGYFPIVGRLDKATDETWHNRITLEAASSVIPLNSRETFALVSGYLTGQGYSGNTNDIMNEWLSSEGYDGSLNDMLLGYLGGLGYTGTLTDRYYSWKRDL